MGAFGLGRFDKAQDVTIKKLTRGNSTMAAKFAELEAPEAADGE